MKPLLPDSEPLSDEQIKVNWRARSRFKFGPYPPAIDVLLKTAVIAVIYLVIVLAMLGIAHVFRLKSPDTPPVRTTLRKLGFRTRVLA